MQRVATVAKKEAETKFEAEKRNLQLKLESEITQLQTHLRIFQKVTKKHFNISLLIYWWWLWLNFDEISFGCFDAFTIKSRLEVSAWNESSDYLAYQGGKLARPRPAAIRDDPRAARSLGSIRQSFTREPPLENDAGRRPGDTGSPSNRTVSGQIALRREVPNPSEVNPAESIDDVSREEHSNLPCSNGLI